MTQPEHHYAVKVGAPAEPKYRNQLVLSAVLMHGDADLDTEAELASCVDQHDRLHAIWQLVAIYKAAKAASLNPTYADLPDEHPFGPDIDEHYSSPDMTLNDDVREMYPWDQTQADYGDYDTRAKLREYALIWYDDLGQAFHAEIEQVF